MAIFNSYVKLPEGKLSKRVCLKKWYPHKWQFFIRFSADQRIDLPFGNLFIAIENGHL